MTRKKTIFHILFLILWFVPHAWADVTEVNCPAIDYVIDSDADFRAFTETTLTCGIVRGDLTITGTFDDFAGYMPISLTEIRGTLSITNSNVEQFKATGFRWDDTCPCGAQNGAQILKYVDRLVVTNNDDLKRIFLTGLRQPPQDILIDGNSGLNTMDLTPETAYAPPTNPNAIQIDGDWVFRGNSLSSLGGIKLGFPMLKLELNGDLTIEDNGFLDQAKIDFEGLRSLSTLSILDHQFDYQANTLGEVTYGTDNFGGMVVSVSGGFRDLESASFITISQNGFRDVSFPSLEEVIGLAVNEYELADLNAPRLVEVDQLWVSRLGTREGVNFGDRAGSPGRDWGLGRLSKVNNQFIIELGEYAEAYGLNAFNIRNSPGLTLGEGANIIIISNMPTFSLAGIGTVASQINWLELGGAYLTDASPNRRFTDLDAFESIVTVNQDVWLRNLAFDDLSFLRNLRTVGGDLQIFNSLQSADQNRPDTETLNGIESIQSIGGDLRMINLELSHCHAVLPLVGWGSSPSRVAGIVYAPGNTPASCNAENFDALREEAAPSDIEVTRLGVARGGVVIETFPAQSSDLFPVVRYEADCRAQYSKSKPILPGQPIVLSADSVSTQELSFTQAGEVEGVSVAVGFQSVDRSRLTLGLNAPDYQVERVLWDSEGSGTKGFDVEFTTQNSELAELVGTKADGIWALNILPGGVDARLTSFRIDLDSLFSKSVPAEEVSGDFVTIDVEGMPAGDRFQCQVSAYNGFDVSSESNVVSVVTPPALSDSPTVLNIEETDGGVLVYFDPTNYWGSQWFGTVLYTVTCDPGSSIVDLSVSSEPVLASPAFLPGLDAESPMACRVTIDNLYEEVIGPVYAYDPPVQQGLPIWLLYEASK